MQQFLFGVGILAVLAAMQIQTKDRPVTDTPKFYTFSVKTIDGGQKSLGDYKGKVLLVVNVASYCGYTPQYSDLEAVYKKYRDRGFAVLAFPANNFGSQEPGTDAEIKTFCSSNYNVTFDLFSKISVKGSDQAQLYRYLTEDSPFKGDVKWNFQKYLIDRKGNVAAMFLSAVKPADVQLTSMIEKLLAQ